MNFNKNKTKKCVICEEVKPFFKFHKNGYGGRRLECAVCRKKEGPFVTYKKYKKDAKRRNLEFKLTKGHFRDFCNSTCHYCGSKLDKVRLDRINNDLGYLEKNVVPCCYPCNIFKFTFNQDVFLKHVEKIYLYQKGKKNDK